MHFGYWRPLLLAALSCSGHATDVKKRSILETKLEVGRTSEVYRKRVEVAWERFNHWIAGQAEARLKWWLDEELVDQLLCDYINLLRDSHSGKLWLARHTVAAAQLKHRALKGRLKRAWDCVSAWQLETPLRSRIPMPLVLLQAAFLFALDWAFSEPKLARYLIPLALVMRIGWFGMLRVGEAASLTNVDLYLPRIGSSVPSMLVAIRHPKNRDAMGRAQYGVVNDQGTIEWARWFVDGMVEHLLLWMGGQSKLVQWFDTVMDRMQLNYLSLTASSWRPGRATHLLMEGCDGVRLKGLGRWASERAMTVFLQEAVSALVWHRLKPQDEDRLNQLILRYHVVWNHPPTEKWQSFFSRSLQVDLPKKLQRKRSPKRN